jgi:hypothetical protein
MGKRPSEDLADPEPGPELLLGPPRIALNSSSASIHDPERARALGFRGSAVGGNLHLDIFAPLLVQTYGPAWFESGALSLYFLNIVVSGERVQAAVEGPERPGEQVGVHARSPDDPSLRICEGTASLGDHSRSALAIRDLKTCEPDRLRLLKGVRPGQRLGRSEMTVPLAEQEAQIASEVNNEPLPWYREASPWGAPIASIGSTAALMFRHLTGDGLHHHHDRISPGIGDASGMFGAFEIAYQKGPVFVDRPYVVEGIVVGVGESPKTEYLWWDATASDHAGEVVVRMRHLFRFIKASSPLYPELAGLGAAAGAT